MDPEELQHDPTKQDQTDDGQGLAGSTQGKARGRPRKATAPGHGFALPAKPEVSQEQKQDGRKFIVIPFRVYQDKQMSRQALRILVMLAAHANRNGFLWCGMQRIADDLGVTQEAVSQQVSWLKQAGYIEETAKPYYGGPTARTATLRIIFDPSMSAEDVIARDSRADERVMPNIREANEAITSANGEVVDSGRSRSSPADTAAGLIAEVLARYRSEGLTPPTGHALEREAAMLASMRVRQGLSL